MHAHIQAFKLFFISTFGRLHPLAHTNKGLTFHNILHFNCVQKHSMKLTIIVQDVFDWG